MSRQFRNEENAFVTLFKLKNLKANPSHLPVLACAVGATALATWYLWRIACRGTEVSWSRTNAEPWNRWATVHHKFLTIDTENFPKDSPAPKYDQDK